MIGLPVLVMETSPRPLIELAFVRIEGGLTAARTPLKAGEVQDLCIFGR